MIGDLDRYEMEKVLRRQFIGRIACHANDVTYIVPISYAYDGTNIYCHTYEGMKIHMLRQNPKVCFEVEIMENMGNWKSVIAWGEFEELINPDERKKGIQELLDRTLPVVSEKFKTATHWPFPPSDLNKVNGIVFRVKLTEKTGKFEQSEPPYTT
jgi:uncharacterized protein